jgi:hypothetical protein
MIARSPTKITASRVVIPPHDHQPSIYGGDGQMKMAAKYARK